MSIYHNDMHLDDNPAMCRFLVDRNGDCWNIMLIFPNFNEELVGDYVFIASNEQGYDKAKLTLKLKNEATCSASGLKNKNYFKKFLFYRIFSN
jgi:hypothetical protein